MLTYLPLKRRWELLPAPLAWSVKVRGREKATGETHYANYGGAADRKPQVQDEHDPDRVRRAVHHNAHEYLALGARYESAAVARAAQARTAGTQGGTG